MTYDQIVRAYDIIVSDVQLEELRSFHLSSVRFTVRMDTVALVLDRGTEVVGDSNILDELRSRSGEAVPGASGARQKIPPGVVSMNPQEEQG